MVPRSYDADVLSPLSWCCNNSSRDDYPRTLMSKGLLSKLTVLQADFCPRPQFYKLKAIDIIFFPPFYIQLIFIDRRLIWASLSGKAFLEKSLLGQRSAWRTIYLDKSPLDNCLHGQSPLGQLLQSLELLLRSCPQMSHDNNNDDGEPFFTPLRRASF